MKRRNFIQLSAALSLGFATPALRAAMAGRDPRLVLLILRGGMDGLAAVPPWGDAAYAEARGALAMAPPGPRGGMTDLDGFFGLHPAFTELAQLYQRREALLLHAVAPPYAGRSHFDAQDALETGLADPTGTTSGWLYRALADLRGELPEDRYAYALGSNTPRVLRGENSVGSWSPDRLPTPDEDTLNRVLALYDRDPFLGPRLASALATDALVTGMAGMDSPRRRQSLPQLASMAARLLSQPTGPRVAVMESGGWDTHARQGRERGLLAGRFKALDRVLGQLPRELGQHWQQTVVLVVTEFGRTVAANGTAGSDHGVGGAAFMLGGAVAGGRVFSRWPGLAPAQLHQQRDLQPTLDMRALFAGVLHEHMGMSRNALQQRVFPGLNEILTGLVRVPL